MDHTESRIPVNIEDEMKKSYMDYAMSVIIGRALPDIRDGLKPVHRRILYAMHDAGNHHEKPYRKSAKTVGEVIGKYHPHGDAAVYDTIVRMAQDFSLRYCLIDGQGNFGSVDGDPPAAMRYTEIRMEKITHELLSDIDKETVDFGPNYDASEQEPLVLPASFPNLIINGSSGIAVGMATNIPPHNLSEVIDAVKMVINDPEVTTEELMKVLPGPDFPTGAYIYGINGIREAYETGRGKIVVRAKAEVEVDPKRDKESIIITEIPYQVNKAQLIEEIALLIKDKRIEGISDIRDESDREGIRIVMEVKRGEQSAVILNNLYKRTNLQITFGAIFLAIVNNQPKILSLKELIKHFIDFRKEVVIRKTTFGLRKAEEKAHILEGLKIAIDHLDEVINLIKKSKTPPEAKEALIRRFNFSDIQAQSILDMKLQRLTGLEREKIADDYQQTLMLIEKMKQILASERLVLQIILEDIERIKKEYADQRRTHIVAETKEITLEDMIAEEEMVITCSHSGYIKRSPLSSYRSQRRGGKGKIGMTTKEEDFVEHLFIASTHSYILVFTDSGKVHWLKVHEIPEVGSAGKGKAIVNLINISSGERVAALLSVKSFEEGKFILMATKKGFVKKTDLTAFSNPRAGGIRALTIDEEDDLFSVKLTDNQGEVFIATHGGKSIRFNEKEIRPMGRAARGVRGIRLRKDDYLVEMEALSGQRQILTVTEKGFGKRTDIKEYRVQGRGGSGIINIKTTQRNGKVVGVMAVEDEDQVMMITLQGKIIRMRINGISIFRRSTQGVRLIELDEGDEVVSVVKVVEKEEEE
ncbi:MAG: DNA gyrase subunit A [Acidobacteriota bacterium]